MTAPGQATWRSAATSPACNARLTPSRGEVRLRILVDRSSVEVFADRGQRVITDQVFAASTSQGIALFAEGGTAKLDSLHYTTWRRQPACPR